MRGSAVNANHAMSRRLTSQQVMTRQISETSFQSDLVDLAETLGFLVYHTHDSRRSQKGFPDLVMVRERVIYAELKRETGKVTPEQQVWIETLTRAREEVYVWRPSDWDSIVEVLKRRVPR